MKFHRGRMAADRFTQVSNDLFHDDRLSLKAKGLFGLLSTFRDGHGISLTKIMGLSTDGRDATRAAVAELEAYGYLERRQGRYETGRMGAAEYLITDSPQTENPTDVGNPDDGGPDSGQVGEPPDSGPPPLSKDTKNTDAAGGDGKTASPEQGDRASGAVREKQIKDRSRLITEGFLERYRTYRFESVYGIVKRYVADGRPESVIVAALARLGDQDRTVTLDTLRVEMNGGFQREQRPRTHDDPGTRLHDNGLEVLW